MPLKKKVVSESSQILSLTRAAEASCKGGYSICIGIDEAGRGPLAGPVVCAAVLVDESIETIEGVVDSKKVTLEEDREETFERLIKTKGVKYSVSVISHVDIDRLNILQATLTGMRNALIELMKKAQIVSRQRNCIALIDGNKIPDDMPLDCKFVIKGDNYIFSIAAASIIAKVTRDRIMHDLSIKYPVYLLSKHKGYPTFEHRNLLYQHGPSEIHRYSYKPVKDACLKHGMKLPSYLPQDDEVTKQSSKKIIKSKKSIKSPIGAKTTKKSVRKSVTSKNK